MRLATSAERTAFLPEIGIWTTDTGRVIHPGPRPRAVGRAVPVAGPRPRHRRHRPRHPARRRAHRAPARHRGIPHHRAARRPDQGRARAGRRPASCGAGRRSSRLETLRGQYRQAPGRSGVVQKAGDSPACPPPNRGQPRTAQARRSSPQPAPARVIAGSSANPGVRRWSSRNVPLARPVRGRP